MDQKNIGKPFIEIGSQHAQQQYTIYTLPRVFRDDAKLHPFLAEKTPDLINLDKKAYTLYDVLLGLRQVISKEKLYDPNNTTVIICSPGLEAALDMRSMHVTEVRDLVLLQMDVAHPDLLASLTPPEPHQQPQTVAAGGQPVFDTKGQFWVKPLFMQVLRLIPGIPPNKVVFSYKEVVSFLSEYILEHEEKFFDKRNIKVAHVETDPLGRAFGVKVFHRTQVTALLRKQLIPFKPQDMGSVRSQNGGPITRSKSKRHRCATELVADPSDIPPKRRKQDENNISQLDEPDDVLEANSQLSEIGEGRKNYSCEPCNFASNRIYNYYRHTMSVKHSKTCLECKNALACSYKTKSVDLLNLHEKNCEWSIKFCRCEKCGFKANCKAHLKLHILQMHATE